MTIKYLDSKRIVATSADVAVVSNRGTIDTSSSAGNTIITFTESGTFTPTSAFNVEYLVVAGGGAGGGNAAGSGGGGGAGGMLTGTGHAVTAQSYSITVGAGGIVGSSTAGGSGGNSIFSTFTSIGGGGGGNTASTGGSGGGGSNGSTGGTGTTGQGNDGGGGSGGGASYYASSGGGGKGSVGATGSGSSAGNGGTGLSSSITGTATFYAAGGGGGIEGGTGGAGGSGIGGTGSNNAGGSSGDVNTGSGGGGGSASESGFTGGSGIVIIKFATSGNTYDTSAGGKPTNVQDNSILVEKDTANRYWFDDEFSKTGLKAYYKFDESSGDIINQATSVGSTDSLGSDADIQITGATYSQTGKIATALSFDGINDYGVIGTSTSQFNFLHSTTAKWTICFWMKLVASSRGTFDRIFNTTVASGTAGINIYLNDLSSTQKMGFVIHNSTSGQGVCDWVSTANDYIPDDTNTWHFYSLTYDQSLGSNNFKIKRDNGNLEQQTKTSNSPVNTNSTYVMHLNRLPSGSGNFPANLIDDFSVWNRVLTDDEISTLYNAGTGKTVDTAKGATWTMNPTFEDDFSSDGWTDNDSTYIGVSGGSMNWNCKRDGTNDASVYDLTSTSANWVLRFKLTVTNVSSSTQAGNGFYVGLSDSIQTAGQSTSQDFIGVSIYNDNTDTYRTIDADGSALPRIYQGDSNQSTTYNTGSVWYYEIIKTGSSYTVEAFSGSDYSTGSEGKITGSSDASGLRYLKVLNDMESISTSTNPFQGTINDLKFYNGVTSV